MGLLNATSVVEANGEAHFYFLLFIFQQYAFSFTMIIVIKYLPMFFVFNLTMTARFLCCFAFS